MRRYLILSFSKIELDNSWSVDWISFIRIDNDAKESRVGVDQLSLVTDLQIMKYGGII